jgi:hypothetical protein
MFERQFGWGGNLQKVTEVSNGLGYFLENRGTMNKPDYFTNKYFKDEMSVILTRFFIIVKKSINE